MNDLERLDDINQVEFDHSLPMLMHGALNQIMKPYRDLFARHGLTEQQWRVLRVLWSAPRSPSVMISQRTQIAPNSLVGVLERLEKRGLLKRKRSEQDRREVLAELTADGEKLGRLIAPQLADVHAQVSQLLPSAEMDSFKDLLGKIRDSKPGEHDG